MAVEGDIDLAVQVALKRIAEGMLRAMVFFQTTHMSMLNVPNTGVTMKRKRDTRQIVGMSIVTGFKRNSTYTIYPNPSKPGEYPRKITGQGQAGVTYGPTTAEEIIANGMVSHIGHRAFMGGTRFKSGKQGMAAGTGWNYMVTLEENMNRLGYAKTAETVRAQMTALVQQK
jgi:hypothetical protein